MNSQTTIIDVLENRLAKNPHLRAFARLADAYRQNGDIPKAIELCTRGIEYHSTYVTGMVILGRCYLEVENCEGAIGEFTRACRLDRRNLLAIKLLADTLVRQGLTEKAADLYSVLKHLDPFDPSVIQLSNQYKGSGKTDLFEILGWEEAVAAGPILDTIENKTAGVAGDTNASSEIPVSMSDIAFQIDQLFADESAASAEMAAPAEDAATLGMPCSPDADDGRGDIAAQAFTLTDDKSAVPDETVMEDDDSVWPAKPQNDQQMNGDIIDTVDAFDSPLQTYAQAILAVPIDEPEVTTSAHGESTTDIDSRDKPYSIPDHVITPTLADIYFQQGQPRLALQIISRLHEKDPDNEQIAMRLQEIHTAIARGTAPEPPGPPEAIKPSRQQKPRAVSSTHRRRKTQAVDAKPLAGVKINKNRDAGRKGFTPEK